MDKPRKKQGKPGGLPGGRDILPDLKKEESVVPSDLLIRERSRLDSSLQFWGVDLWFPPGSMELLIAAHIQSQVAVTFS